MRVLIQNSIYALASIHLATLPVAWQRPPHATTTSPKAGLQQLAIAHFIDGRLTIVEFNGSVLRSESNFYFTSSSFGPDGTRIAGNAGGQLTVLDEMFKVSWRHQSPTPNVLNVSLSHDGSQIAVVGTRKDVSRAEIWVVEAAGPQRRVYEFAYNQTRDGSCSIGWDNSGRRLAFGVESQVRILDLTNGLSKEVSAGSEAAWSPDGKRIAYRGMNGQGRVLDLDKNTDESFGKGPIVSAIHWAPNSEYLLVQEESRHKSHTDLCVSDERLVIYRLFDNFRSEVYNTCGLRDWYFGWIVGPSRWMHTFRSPR